VEGRLRRVVVVVVVVGVVEVSRRAGRGIAAVCGMGGSEAPEDVQLADRCAASDNYDHGWSL